MNHLITASEQPIRLSLYKRPLCQTLSKALEISQKTARTSLPESTASQNVWYVCNNWLVVESPGANPDWKGVSIWFSQM